jgi:hypothetical protein
MTYPQAVAKPTNGLATASFVIGLIAIIGSWIPVLNIGSLVLAGVALIMALIALGRARKNGGVGVGMSITGLVLALATAIVAPVVNLAAIEAVEEGLPPSLTEILPTDEPTSEGVDSGETMGQQQALRKGKEYLLVTAFSKEGLAQQLAFEGHEIPDAQYAVDHLDVDWSEQAALKAGEYLEVTSFSRTGLIEQLVYDGFTNKQAEHGVTEAGL